VKCRPILILQTGYRICGKRIESKQPQNYSPDCWPTDDLKNASTAASLKDTFDLVSLLIELISIPGQELSGIPGEFRDLLKRLFIMQKEEK